MNVNLTGIDKNLLLDFVCMFSRFEYALKRTGFATGDRSRVSADWECFGKMLRPLRTEQLEPVLRASEYIRKQPPKKQTLQNGHLGFSDAVDQSISELERVLIYVRRVRNNLFHGGKCDETVEGVARNQKLLEESNAVLRAVLDLPGSEKVRENFVET